MKSQSESRDALLVQELLSPFRERPLAVEPAAESEARVQRIVPNLEEFTRGLVATRRRHQLYRRGGWLLAALSAGVGAGLLYGRMDEPVPFDGVAAFNGVTVSGELVQVGEREERTILSGSLEVSPLGRVETKETGAEITTREGLDLTLGPATSARIGELGGTRPIQRVRLESGSLECKVPKLPSGSQFSVVTPDALVVVHGTRFTVEVQPDEDGSPRTCVRVSEGKVAVHGKASEPVFLLPGEQLGCTVRESEATSLVPVPAEALELSQSQKPVVSASAKRSRALSTSGKRPVLEEQGTLARETALLQAAVGAEQRGDVEGARAKLHELLSQYPNSPLGEDARLMLGRLTSRQP